MTKDVSIILVNYNTKELTSDCIKSIYEKTNGLDYDIWLVDNASTDGTCERIKQDYPDVKVIENTQNIGFGKANNIAIEACDSKYVLCLNTDTILMNNAVKVLYDFMERREDALACGGDLYDANGCRMHSFGEFPTLRRFIFRHFGLGFLVKSYRPDRDVIRPVEQIIGADLMIRKSSLDKSGAFHPAFFLYMEELELQYRLRKEKGEIYYIPQAKIIHLKGRSSSNQMLRKQLIKRSEYVYYVLTNSEVNKIWIKLICTFYNLYSVILSPKEAIKTIKYFWTTTDV